MVFVCRYISSNTDYCRYFVKIKHIPEMEVQYNYGQIFNQVINALLKFLFIASKTLMKSWVVNANTAGAAFD